MSRHPSSLSQIADAEASTLEYLVERGSTISTESKSLAFVDSIKSTFYDFVSRLTNFITTLKAGNYKSQKLAADDVVALVEAKTYQETRNLYVNVPVGFQGKWVDYLNFLSTQILPQVARTDATLKSVIQRMAVLLNEPDRLKAQSGLRELDRSLDVISQEQLDKMKRYVANGSKYQRRLGEVMERNADFKASYELINKINSELGVVDFAKIQDQVTRLSELTQSLQETMKSDEGRELSGLVTSQLSELFFKLGVSLTAGAVLMDAVTQQTVAMDTTLTSLREQLK